MRRRFCVLMTGLLMFGLTGCSVFNLMVGDTNVRRVKILGAAMEPNFHDGQIVDVEEIPVEELQRGDVILFKVDEDRQYLKRLIGLPGETLEIRDNKVYINGKVLDEPYIKEPVRGDSMMYVMGSDEYFVMGDNRDNSADSRVFGSIPGESILGRVKQ